MNDFRKIYEEIEIVKEDVRSANKTEVAADLSTCHRHDMPSEETEAVKEGTSTPTWDRKTRRKKQREILRRNSTVRFALSWLVRLVRHLRVCVDT